MKKIRVGIIGGAGYTAGELLRILLNHPSVDVTYVHSTSNSGKKVTDIHTDLLGDTDLVFSGVYDFSGLDVIFLCMGHGKSVEFMNDNQLPESLKVIDLSTDYRMKRDNNNFVYGLPELNAMEIKSAKYIANPGCFATGIQLALLPLAHAGLLTDEIHVNAITGSTGAGVKLSSTSHFSWRNNNVSIYKAFTHQHLHEINQSLHQLQPSFAHAVNFIPVRGNFTRGILAASYTKCDLTLKEATEIYREFYREAAFTFVVDKNPDLKQVVNTNKALVYLEKHEEKLLVVSVIDNLLKGASGQAVQNMNLMFGFPETMGLC